MNNRSKYSEINQNIKSGKEEPDRLLRLSEVLKLIPVSRSSWYQGIKDGKYPPPIKLGPRTSAWRESDIMALMEKDE